LTQNLIENENLQLRANTFVATLEQFLAKPTSALQKVTLEHSKSSKLSEGPTLNLKKHKSLSQKNKYHPMNRMPDLTVIYLLDPVHNSILNNTHNLPPTIHPKLL
jgi:hypothetical protein